MEPSQPNQESAVTELKSSGLAVKKWVAITHRHLCAGFLDGTIDVKSEKYVQDAISQALVAYAGARTLNAGISLLQSGEIAGKLFFADTSIRPFETLDPLDDMVEDYATIMKYAIGSLMIQKLIVNILSNDVFKWFNHCGFFVIGS